MIIILLIIIILLQIFNLNLYIKLNNKKYPTAIELVNAVMDTAHPALEILGKTYDTKIYKIVWIHSDNHEEIRYNGYDSDLAYKQWRYLESNLDVCKGRHEYYINEILHAVKDNK